MGEESLRVDSVSTASNVDYRATQSGMPPYLAQNLCPEAHPFGAQAYSPPEMQHELPTYLSTGGVSAPRMSLPRMLSTHLGDDGKVVAPYNAVAEGLQLLSDHVLCLLNGCEILRQSVSHLQKSDNKTTVMYWGQ